MTIDKLRNLAEENDIKGPGKRGGWPSGFKKNDIIHYLEEKGLSIPS